MHCISCCCSKRALAATSKAWNAAAWAAQAAAGGHRLSARVSDGPEGPATLQSLLDFLLRRRPRVSELSLDLQSGSRWGQGESLEEALSMAANRERLRGLACAVLALLSDQPLKLTLSSDMGAHWVPRMAHVTQATSELHLSEEDDSLERELAGSPLLFGGRGRPGCTALDGCMHRLSCIDTNDCTTLLLTGVRHPSSHPQPPWIGWRTACRAWTPCACAATSAG